MKGQRRPLAPAAGRAALNLPADDLRASAELLRPEFARLPTRLPTRLSTPTPILIIPPLLPLLPLPLLLFTLTPWCRWSRS